MTKPAKQNWKISKWVKVFGREGHGFEIHVRPEFLRKAQKVVKRYGAVNLSEGFLAKVQDLRSGVTAVRFDEWGLKQIYFSEGTDFYRNTRDEAWYLTEGALYDTHNFDHAYQRDMAMTLWFEWTQLVEPPRSRSAAR